MSTPGASLAGSPTSLARRQAAEAAAAERRAAAAVADVSAMPPLRSIAAPVGSPSPAGQPAGSGTFERLAAGLSAPATLGAAQVWGKRGEGEISCALA
jgi:hypothetical protein